MKKHFTKYIIALIVTILFVQLLCIFALASTDVYITGSGNGTAYHLYEDCRALSRSKSIKTISESKAEDLGYSLCSYCEDESEQNKNQPLDEDEKQKNQSKSQNELVISDWFYCLSFVLPFCIVAFAGYWISKSPKLITIAFCFFLFSIYITIWLILQRNYYLGNPIFMLILACILGGIIPLIAYLKENKENLKFYYYSFLFTAVLFSFSEYIYFGAILFDKIDSLKPIADNGLRYGIDGYMLIVMFFVIIISTFNFSYASTDIENLCQNKYESLSFINKIGTPALIIYIIRYAASDASDSLLCLTIGIFILYFVSNIKREEANKEFLKYKNMKK